MATTLKSTQNGAKRNILSRAAIKYVGLITSFIGLVLLITNSTITGSVMEISAILLLLIGILLFISNLKLIFASKSDKEVVLQCLIGALFIILGVLLVLYGSQVSTWIDLAVGILIGTYGLILFISHIVNKRKKYFIFDIVLALLLVASGILIALLYEFSSNTYKDVVAIFATVSGLLHVLFY